MKMSYHSKHQAMIVRVTNVVINHISPLNALEAFPEVLVLVIKDDGLEIDTEVVGLLDISRPQ